MTGGFRINRKKTNSIFMIISSVIVTIILFNTLYTKQNEVNELRKTNDALSNQIVELKEIIDKYNDPGNGVNAHGRLSVDGLQLVGEHGKLVQLRGMSSHGIQWYPQYTNYAAIKTTKDYGANVFRIAVYSDQQDGNVYFADEAKLFLYMAIENVLAADMYVIVDWHVLRDQNPNLYIDRAVEFFKEISRRYANNPAVIYEICNEPNGETVWEDIKDYAEVVIPVIRKNSPDAIVLVGTPKYSTDLKSVYDKQLNFDNVMYSYHQYISEADSSYTWQIEDAWKNKVPVFVSEWGFKNSNSDTEALLEDAKLFIDFLNDKNISWVNWSLTNKAEGSAALRDSDISLSGWDIEKLSVSGRFVFKAFNREKDK